MRIKLGVALTLREIALATCSAVVGIENATIEHISTDSRDLFPGDLFIALKGERYDGEDFVTKAISSGCYAMSQSSSYGIYCEDSRRALMLLSSYYLNRLIELKHKIAITGSVGKTTTKDLCRIIISEQFRTHATYGNLNNEIGMPMTVLSAPANTEVIICEMGMNHKGEISRMSKAFGPDVAIITNIGRAHIGNLGSREEIASAKKEITDGMKCGTVIVPFEENLLSDLPRKKTFSLYNNSADFHLESSKSESVKLYKSALPYIEFSPPFFEEHLSYCLLTAMSAAIIIECNKENLIKSISQISRDVLRQKTIKREKYYFYQDFYNASPESIYAAVKALCSPSRYGRKSVLLGDVLELGESSGVIHFEIGRHIATYPLTNVYLFGDFCEYTRDGLIDSGFPGENIFINNDLSAPEFTARQIRLHSQEDEIILMKASHSIRLERVLACFSDNIQNEGV